MVVLSIPLLGSTKMTDIADLTLKKVSSGNKPELPLRKERKQHIDMSLVQIDPKIKEFFFFRHVFSQSLEGVNKNSCQIFYRSPICENFSDPYFLCLSI